MISIRTSQERGKASFGWLDSRHTFSFGQYFDSNYMGFSHLRVINEDKVAPGQGFATHGHRDMEIITYVLEGALEHKDSLGTGSIIRPGDVQRMSAGTGIRHSEYNPSQSEPVHLLQIWIVPEAEGIQPSYEQKAFSEEEKRGKLRLIGSRDGREGTISIYQDVNLYATCLQDGESATHNLSSGRVAWLQVSRGVVRANQQILNTGDGAAVVDESILSLQGVSEDAEVLLFDLKA
jgi:hypothetical protein